MSGRFKNQFGDQYAIEGLLKGEDGWQGSIAWIIHGPQAGLVRHAAPILLPGLYDSKEAAEKACREFADKNRPE